MSVRINLKKDIQKQEKKRKKNEKKESIMDEHKDRGWVRKK